MPHLHKYKTTFQSSNCGSCGQEREKHCCNEYFRQRTIEYIGYEEWLPNVRIALADEVEDGILFDYIRRGAIEFAKQSTILRRNITLTLQDCVGDYYPCLGEQERIDKVRMLSINGTCYTAIGDSCTWNISGTRYWFHPPHTLEIHPMPKHACDSQVILTVIATPSENSQTVDKLIFDRYFNAIENYAVAKAMMLPVNVKNLKRTMMADLMSYRMREFNNAVARAKIDIAEHYGV